MRLARIATADGPQAVLRDGDSWLAVRSLFDPVPTGARYDCGARLLAPLEPGHVVGVAHPSDATGHHVVQGWLKSTRGVAGPGETIHLNPASTVVVAEGELALVIGRRASNLTLDNALAHVLGYTIANDVTNAAPLADAVFFASKCGTNYTPIGPWIETDVGTPDDCAITVTDGPLTVRESTTAALPHSMADILVALTHWLTLEPGDVVLTGSPSTDAMLTAGSTIAITIAGIGTLTNAVA